MKSIATNKKIAAIFFIILIITSTFVGFVISVGATNNEISAVGGILEKGNTISGRVICHQGYPVANATINVWGCKIWNGYKTWTDVNGYYAITNLATDIYEVKIIPPREVNLAPVYIINVEVIASKTTVLNVILEKGSTITGRIICHEGFPVANATVSIWDSVTYNECRTWLADNNHYIIVDLIDGTCEMDAILLEEVNIAPDYMRIGVWTPMDDALGWTKTDVNGYYIITNLAVGTHIMEVSSPYGVNLASVYIDNVDVIAGETTVANVTLKKGGIISGRVVCHKGYPVANAEVYVWDDMMAKTDINGYYTIIGLATDTYIIDVIPPHGVALKSTSTYDIKVIAGETTVVNTILEKSGVISGRVICHQGYPVANAAIFVWYSTLDFDTMIGFDDGFIQTHSGFGAWTDANGYYTITNVVDGTYRMEVTTGEGVNLASAYIDNIEVITGEITVLNITLEKGGTISGRVICHQGYPVANTLVRIRNRIDGFSTTVYTNSDGYYTITGLTFHIPMFRMNCWFSWQMHNLLSIINLAGIYEIRICTPYGVNLAPAFISNINVFEGETHTVNFILEKGGTISGRVICYMGYPVVDAMVRAWNPITWNHGRTRTDANGYYIIMGLATDPEGMKDCFEWQIQYFLSSIGLATVNYNYKIEIIPPTEEIHLASASVYDVEVFIGKTTIVNATLEKMVWCSAPFLS